MLKPRVFLGPSLDRISAGKIIEAEFHPPIRRGDISKLGKGDAPVIIIDGEFGQNLSVSPKEILSLLNRKVPVLGSSSMGALRAVELKPYGMIGRGWVYNQFLCGKIAADDEVALCYNPIDLISFTVPLVNVRYWISILIKSGRISLELAETIISTAKKIFFADRTPRHLFERLRENLADDVYNQQLKLPVEPIPNIKMLDARNVLEYASKFV